MSLIHLHLLCVIQLNIYPAFSKIVLIKKDLARGFNEVKIGIASYGKYIRVSGFHTADKAASNVESVFSKMGFG